MVPLHFFWMQYKGQKATEIDNLITQNSKKIVGDSSLKIKLDTLSFTRTRVIDIAGQKKALIIYVPCNQIKTYQSESQLVNALEKNLNGYQIHVVADRKIEHRAPNAYRPYVKTQVAVHEAIFEDLVSPAYITGKRVLYSNGNEVHKFFVCKAKKTEVENRLTVASKVYETLAKLPNVQIDFQ